MKLKRLWTGLPNIATVSQLKKPPNKLLVLPFIDLFRGFDIYDPHEVCPEYTADVGVKKGEKVDYAILIDNEPVMLFECKLIHNDLNLNIYLNCIGNFCHPAKIGVLTNESCIQIFTDLQEGNKFR